MAVKHRTLVLGARRWLRDEHNCSVVVQEFKAGPRAVVVPDALGWLRQDGHHRSRCVECKVTRADFAADRKKKHHLGEQRWYLVPEGLVKPTELPRGWGLLYYHPGRPGTIEEVRPAPKVLSDLWRELDILVAVLGKVNVAKMVDVAERVGQMRKVSNQTAGDLDRKYRDWLTAVSRAMGESPGTRYTLKAVLNLVEHPYVNRNAAQKRLLAALKKGEVPNCQLDEHAAPYECWYVI